MHKGWYNGWVVALVIVGFFLGGCGDSNHDYSSSSGHFVSGIVADDPVSGAVVNIYNSAEEVVGTGTTDDNGTYRIEVEETGEYRVVASGGSINGVPFTGRMENICTDPLECDVTPLSTLALEVAEQHGYLLERARQEARLALGIQEDDPDPFALAVRGKSEGSESGEIEGLDRVNLEYLRTRIKDHTSMETWLQERLETVPEPYNEIVEGEASVGFSLMDADVELALDEEQLSAGVTDENGTWETAPELNIYQPFRIEVRNGYTFAEDFEGTLSAYVPFRDAGYSYSESVELLDNLEVNVLSTIIERYMRFSECSYAAAVERVKFFLSISEETDLSDTGQVRRYFNPQVLLENAEELGFDTYIDLLVQKVDSGEQISIGGAQNAFTGYQIIKVGMGTKIFNGVVGGLASGGLSFALDTGMTYLLPAMGFETAEQKLQATLDEIKDTLKTMSDDIIEIGDDVKTLLANLDIAVSEIISENVLIEVNKYTDIIEYNFNRMLTTDDAKAFVEGLPNIGLTLQHIHSHMFKPSSGAQSAFEALTKKMEKKIRAAEPDKRGDVLWSAYLALENYFNNIIGIQLQGAILEANNINWKNYAGTSNESVATFTEEDLAPIIVKQIDMFMGYVERLVVASADTRSIIQGGGTMFPSRADDVFYSADLIAQQFDPKHRAGFVVRVAGDPTIIEEFFTSPEGQSFGPHTFVPIGGKNIRSYSAPIPDGYPAYYLGWKIDRDARWNFNQQEYIQIAKLRFDVMEGHLEDKSPSDFPFTRTYVYKFNPNYKGALTKKKTVEFKEIDLMAGDEGNEGIPYANMFIEARVVPFFNFVIENQNKYHLKQGHWDTTNFSANLDDVSLEAEFVSRRLESHSHDGEVDVQAQMLFEVINDSGVDMDLWADGKVKEKIENNKGGDNNLGLDLELHWQIKVGGNSLVKHEWQEDWHKFSPYGFAIEGLHKHTTEFFDRRATWKNGQMYQLIFNASRNQVIFTPPPTYNEKALNVKFDTQLEYFELK